MGFPNMLEPSHRMTELELKFEPFTVRLNDPVPAIRLVGLNEAMLGDGLLTVKVKRAVRPPPGPGLKARTW